MQETVINARTPRTGLDLGEIWRYRELLGVLVRRDIAVRYQEAVLGLLWAVLQPLGLMAIFSIVFGRVAGLHPTGVPYPLFAFSGLLTWMLFAQSLQAAGSSVLNSRALISKVYFPRLVIPLAAVGAPMVDFLISSALMMALLLGYGLRPTAQTLWVLPLALIAVVAAIGVGSMVAALSAAYRDFRHLLPFIVSSWLFLTPVIYPPTVIPPAWRWLLELNPIAGVVDGIRSAWLGMPFDVSLIERSAFVAALLFVAGIRYFRAVERRFADLL